MLKQNLSQKQLQKLSPQQIQLMKLLQIPTAVLDQRIQEELEINPALEDVRQESEGEEYESAESLEDAYYTNKAETPVEQAKTEPDEFQSSPEDAFENEYNAPETQEKEFSDDFTFEEYLEDYMNDDTAAYRLESNNHSPDEEEKTIPIAVESSFHEYLEQQLGLLNLDEKEHKIAEQIIGSIDDDGYLRRAVAAIVDDLAFLQNLYVSEEEVKATLQHIQQFEPSGVGAHDLQECLKLQLLAKLRTEDKTDKTNKAKQEQLKNIRLALAIIADHFDEFSKKHFKKLLRQLNIDSDQLRAASHEILRLNPKPGSAYASASQLKKQYIVPDFIIENKMGELELRLNTRNAPELRINEHYREMLQAYSANKKDKKQREAAMFVKQKIDAARWFIDAIRQRQETMLNTMYTIMQHQRDYFLTGDEKKLRPMILKDIADITGLDISTVSRVANSKYVQTEFGTKRLKDFFSEALQTESGEEVSTLEVKKILTEIISAEDKRKPCSDEKLKSVLQKRGYNIARRTVAKYREQLGIPVARLRKEI